MSGVYYCYVRGLLALKLYLAARELEFLALVRIQVLVLTIVIAATMPKHKQRQLMEKGHTTIWPLKPKLL
jgi:hypothetical protein